MQVNASVRAEQPFTHEGAPAARINAEQQLRRSVMACMLWESGFYESGQEIAQRIRDTVAKVRPEFAAACAAHARGNMKLRHVPLLIVREMARLQSHRHLVAKLLADVIMRPDEITEFLAMYGKDTKPRGNKKLPPLSAQVKRGLASAFKKFDEYQFAKYDRDKEIKLRDALFLAHPKPDTPEQEALFKKIAERKLATPDTWEVSLSGGADKKETFVRLMAENKLGAMAFLRNLRNMQEAGVSKSVVAEYASRAKVERVLPFRFIAAARAVPAWEDFLEPMMLRCLEGQEKLPGRTVLLVDVSGSMDSAISSKSDLQRLDAATGLAILLRDLCEDFECWTFSNAIVQIPPRRGFALRDAIVRSQPHGGTYLGQAVSKAPRGDRLIVLTDEQSHDRVPNPAGKGYMINVASYKNGVGYGQWLHIDGWSEAVIDYLREYEKEAA